VALFWRVAALDVIGSCGADTLHLKRAAQERSGGPTSLSPPEPRKLITQWWHRGPIQKIIKEPTVPRSEQVRRFDYSPLRAPWFIL
jgi:hypothetical protein